MKTMHLHFALQASRYKMSINHYHCVLDATISYTVYMDAYKARVINQT